MLNSGFKVITQTIGLCLLMLALPAKADQQSATEKKATVCTSIKPRIERLNCFDKIFATPIQPVSTQNTVVDKPEIWIRAKLQEKNRTQSEGFAFSESVEGGEVLGLWLTATALSKESLEKETETESSPAPSQKPFTVQTDSSQAVNPQHLTTEIVGEISPMPDEEKSVANRPILVLSCVNEISRVQLILPERVTQGRIPITTIGKRQSTQNWFSDDSGYVLRSGRGLAAIATMKTLLGASTLILRSDLPQVNHLVFDTSNLTDAIQPLRKICRW